MITPTEDYVRQVFDAITTVPSWGDKNLIDAALDQPNPTPSLRAALNQLLTIMRHPDRYYLETKVACGLAPFLWTLS